MYIEKVFILDNINKLKYKELVLWFAFISVLITFTSCKKHMLTETKVQQGPVIFANLNQGKSVNFNAISQVFAESNPGYNMDYIHQEFKISASNENRVVFIQAGGGSAVLNKGSKSKFSIGDIVLLRPSQSIQTDSSFSALVISTPDEIPARLPTFVRPDWDEKITDVPGGCATENNAYRRILLTWKESVGPYVYHSVNAHRVRIRNSFSHYHPIKGRI